MNANELTNLWHREDLSMELIERILGKDHVAWLATREHPIGCCESRAAGSWQANAAESYCAYRSLAKHLSPKE